MAYSELMKNFNKIRGYMRQFFAYGFRSRDEFDAKSARSYDNEKRRVESWLGEYMSFHQNANGKAVFLSVDSRRIPNNPLYRAWKASGFTKNDIGLHFILLDILADGQARTLVELLDAIDKDYLSNIENANPIDPSTLRKKLREYTQLGLLVTRTQGKQYLYALAEDAVNLDGWREAIAFFAQDNPLGVIGSFLQDKYNGEPEPVFTFKHRYLLFALDSGILLELLTAIRENQKLRIELPANNIDGVRQITVVPLKIFQSVQGGRQYLAGYSVRNRRIHFVRIDRIISVKTLKAADDYLRLQKRLTEEQTKIWGVSSGQGTLETLEMVLTVAPKDVHIVHRLEREKRYGTVTKLSGNRWLFSVCVYDSWELMPWLRTFIGRIESLTCSNKTMEDRFWQDYAALYEMYGGDNHVV